MNSALPDSWLPMAWTALSLLVLPIAVNAIYTLTLERPVKRYRDRRAERKGAVARRLAAKEDALVTAVESDLAVHAAAVARYTRMRIEALVLLVGAVLTAMIGLFIPVLGMTGFPARTWLGSMVFYAMLGLSGLAMFASTVTERRARKLARVLDRANPEVLRTFLVE